MLPKLMQIIKELKRQFYDETVVIFRLSNQAYFVLTGDMFEQMAGVCD